VSPKSIHLVAAARPNFMKVAPLYHALSQQSWSRPGVVHTGQHYDANMSDAFFRDLGLPEPTHHLEIGSGSHAEQTGRTMIAYEAVCQADRPDAIVVVGDVNATAACAMVGAKLWIPVVHLEAGLRSRDRRMPEEINRLVTDAIADLLWTPSKDADANLLAEGVPAARIDCIGNIMIDSFEMLRSRIEAADTRSRLQLQGPYAMVTLHRPSNVDARDKLTELAEALVALSRELTVVFAIHPRTRKRLEALGSPLDERVRLMTPFGFLDYNALQLKARAVLSDSGTISEESSILGFPALNLREAHERPEAMEEGAVMMTGLRLARVGDLMSQESSQLRCVLMRIIH